MKRLILLTALAALPGFGQTIGTLTPASATAGSVTFSIVVTGTGLGSTSVVEWTFGGVTTALPTGYFVGGAGSYLLASVDYTLVAAAGTATVAVRNGTNPPSASVSFPINPPVITGLSPASRTAGTAGNFALTVTGTGFLSNTAGFESRVYFGSTELATTYNSATQLTATVPATLITTPGSVDVTVRNPVGFTFPPTAPVSSPFTFTVLTVPSTLTSLSPAFVRAGSAPFTLTVNGTGFSSGMRVRWGLTELTTTFVSTTQLTATVPATVITAPGSATITAIAADGVVSSNALVFQVLTNPQITSITPPSAAAGTYPLNLTINGSGFVPAVAGTTFTPGSTVVWTVGTTPTDLATTYVSATQVQASVPPVLANVAGTASITVRNPDTMVSPPVAFVLNPPAISGLAPSSRTAGSGDFTLVVNGSNFLSVYFTGAPTTSQVSFGGTAVPTTFVNAGQLTATVSASLITAPAPRTVNVTVTNPGGSVSAAVPFTVLAPPTISSATPNPVTAGSGAFTLAVNGANIPAGATVQWNGTPLATTVVSAAQANAAVPAALVASPGAANVTILTPDGVTSNAVIVSIVSSPLITAISPPGAAAGTSPLNLTINGSGFLPPTAGDVLMPGATVVWTAGATATDLATTFVSAAQLQASVPPALANVPGTAFITVRNPDGAVSPAVAFVVSPPAITTLAPSSRTAGAAAFTLTVNGSSFVSNVGAAAAAVPQVYFGGTAVATTFVSATQLTAAVPAALITTPGTVNVTVQNPGGATSAASPFTILPAPAITGLNPSAVAIGAGFNLIVQGSNFPSGAIVRWNGAALTTTVTSATQATAAVPASLVTPVGSASITIVTPDGVSSNAWAITVAPILAITTTSLPDGLEQSPYSAFLQATGAPPYTWSLAGGSLPPGLGLAGNGAIGGTPQSAGTFHFTVRVTDSSSQTATRELSIMIDERIPPLQIETAALAGGTVGVTYSQGLSASGGEPPYGWTATGLPPGLSVAGGTITGTPTKTGVYSVSVQVSDAARRTASKSFTLTIVAPPLVITTAAAADGVMGSPYSQTFAATGGIPPYRWAASGGALPPGTTMSSSGTLSGTPNSTGTFSFTVMVEDSEKKVTNKGFTVTIAAPGLSITTASLPPGTVNVPYSASLAAAGGAPPYTWSGGGGALTVGGGGTVSGTPSQQGVITVTARVTDSAGATASRSFEVLIGGPALSITTASIGNGTVGVPYSASFAAAGGTPPYSWSMPAGWAGGLSFDSGGSLSGTPADAGDYSIVVRVTDSQGQTATRGFNFTIDAPVLTITTASLPQGTVGSGYYTIVAATGNIGPVTWSADGLPQGLSMDPGGALSGTPSAAGSFTVTARAADQGGRTASRSLSLSIGLPAAPPVTFGGVPDISGPATQPTLQVGLSNPYPVPLTGVVTLTFTPQSGRDDPAVQFSTGGRTASFTIPAGANTASFPVPNLGVQTGTVAGRITLTATLSAGGTDVTPSPAPSRTITINASAPVITEVRATRTATGFDVQITGYSTTREVTQIVFLFTAAAGANLQTTEATVNVQPLFAGWFTGAASAGFGSRFTFTQPFTITGDTTAITSLSVTLVSGQGNSNTVTANLQ